MPIIAGECVDQAARVRSSAQAERGEVERGRPAFRAHLQPLDVLHREAKAERVVEEGACLLVAEAEFVCA